MNLPVIVLRLTAATSLLAFLCGAKASSASNTPTRRPTETNILADFEISGSAAAWKGLPCERTDERASSSRYALRFTVPAWAEGREPRPGIRLPLDFGNGSADLSLVRGYGHCQMGRSLTSRFGDYHRERFALLERSSSSDQ